MTRICALHAAVLYMQTALAIQGARIESGDFTQVAWLAPLYQLYEYIRLGVCSQTRILEGTELPDLDPLLAQLPLTLRTRLEGVIKEELAGQSVHVSSEVRELAREVMAEATPQQLQAGHSV